MNRCGNALFNRHSTTSVGIAMVVIVVRKTLHIYRKSCGGNQRPYEKPHLNGASPPLFHTANMLVTKKS